MDIIRKILKPAAVVIACHMLLLSGFSQSLSATMIGTESIIKTEPGPNPRDALDNLLARKDFQAALISQGIDLQEARERIEGLSDEEIAKWVHQMDPAQAGGGFFEAFIVVAFLTFLILLITDISGYTDVFPFVKKQAVKDTARDQTAAAAARSEEMRPSPEDSGINPADILIIYFKPDSNDLTARAIESLDRVVRFMAKNAKTGIHIIGFSDSDASSSYDVTLSESRANTVKSYLIARGIDSKKISSLGMGTQGFSAIHGTEAEKQLIGGAALEFKQQATK